MLVDSHCHLDYFTPAERPDVLARARAAGVGRMVTIGTYIDRAAEQQAIADAEADVWCTVGTHPHHAAEAAPLAAEAIAALAQHERTIGIGEAGLDYFYDRAPRDAQQATFRCHIEASRLTGLPLCIHTRDADDDTLAILREESARGAFPFLLHCFSGGAALAEGGVALGGYVSFSGIVTFPKSDALRDIAGRVPLDRMLVETDSPYLAPVPVRGKRCEPAYVAHTARRLAALRGVTEDELGRITTENFFRLFRKAA